MSANSDNNPVLLCSFAILSAVLLIGALLQHSDIWAWGIAAAFSSCFTLYAAWSTGAATDKYGKFMLLFIGLFLYSLLTSNLVVRSALIATNAFAAFLFACTLLDQSQSKFCPNYLTAANTIKLVLTLIIGFHSLTMLGSYLQEPARVTGIVRDYSQASMMILIGYGLIFPQLRSRRWGFVIVAALFLGFFCSFSRSANFLLIIFMAALLIHCLKIGAIKQWVIHSTTIMVCCALVYIYPLLIEQDAISRGGLAHFSTLNSRLFYWQAAWEAIQANPWTGYGLGNFEWSGIKGLIPFQYIPSVHNDYLQIWLDLGVFWLLTFVVLQVWFLARHLPVNLRFFNKQQSSGAKLFAIHASETQFIAWTLLALISAYMLINFIISFLFFQLLIALLVCEVVHED